MLLHSGSWLAMLLSVTHDTIVGSTTKVDRSGLRQKVLSDKTLIYNEIVNFSESGRSRRESPS